MKIKKKIKKKSGSKTEILRNPQAQPERLVSYKKKRVYGNGSHIRFCSDMFLWEQWNVIFVPIWLYGNAVPI